MRYTLLDQVGQEGPFGTPINLMSSLSTASLAARAPAASQVAAMLRQRVRSGGLSVGELLPPERQLAQSIGVARGTLRHALQLLEREGVIHQHGQRRRVHAMPTTGTMTRTLAALVFSHHSGTSHRTPGWETFVEVGFMEQARDSRHSAMMVHIESATNPEELDQLLDRPLLGMAVCSSAYRHPQAAPVIDRLKASGIPLVFDGDPALTDGYDRVVSDHAAGAEMVTRYLLQRGRRRIAYLLPNLPTNEFWVRRRLEGYRRAVHAAGLEPLPPLYTGRINELTRDPSNFEVAVMQVLGYLVTYQRTHGGIDAVMCASDGLVPHTAAALKKLGLIPQKDVLVAGYDNFHESFDTHQFEPTLPIVSVDKNNIEIGRRLARLLLDPRGPGQPPRTEVVNPRLIEVSKAP